MRPGNGLADMHKKETVKSGNTTVIPCGYVDPNRASSTQLGPGTYSLNKRSNVPFVGLRGSAGFQKTISWGEIAEVPAGQLISVVNASYHGGDIFVNKGPDMCNRPSRITVPVQFQNVAFEDGEGDNVSWSSVFPCDTRAAKRAYVNIDAVTIGGNTPLTVFIRGRRLDGSMKTENSLAQFVAPWGPGVGFLSALVLPVASVLLNIPLGLNAPLGDDTRPHTLLDAGDVFVVIGAAGLLTDVMTWPAGADIFEFPAGQAPAPGCFYTIEYD